MKNFLGHRRLCCRECFGSSEAITYPHPKWKTINDPGAWGSATPRILVLGFSKGETQKHIYASGSFDDVAFGGEETRRNLTNILRAAKLLNSSEICDQKIKATEREFAFGSLVRCSCGRIDEKKAKKNGKDNYKTSGPLIVKSFAEIPAVIDTCSKKYLSGLPKSVELVCFLGVTDAYIKKCKNLMRSLYPNGFEDISPVSYKTHDFLCVHLTHPSKGNGTINAWLKTDLKDPKASKRKKASAKKRERAIKAIEDHGIV